LLCSIGHNDINNNDINNYRFILTELKHLEQNTTAFNHLISFYRCCAPNKTDSVNAFSLCSNKHNGLKY